MGGGSTSTPCRLTTWVVSTALDATWAQRRPIYGGNDVLGYTSETTVRVQARDQDVQGGVRVRPLSGEDAAGVEPERAELGVAAAQGARRRQRVGVRPAEPPAGDLVAALHVLDLGFRFIWAQIMKCRLPHHTCHITTGRYLWSSSEGDCVAMCQMFVMYDLEPRIERKKVNPWEQQQHGTRGH